MIDCVKKENSLYFHFNGELDESCAIKVRSFMDEMLDKYPKKKIVMDMKNLKFMDSTGIGILIGRYKRIANNNGVVYILNPQPAVDKILKFSGIYQIMPKIER